MNAAVRQAHQGEMLARLVGKKVTVSTTDFHYLVGQLVDLLPDDRLRISVAGRDVLLRRTGLARIYEADPALAEYIK
jgi:hypothetical protein